MQVRSEPPVWRAAIASGGTLDALLQDKTVDVDDVAIWREGEGNRLVCYTPLGFSLAHNNEECIRGVLEAGANIDLTFGTCSSEGLIIAGSRRSALEWAIINAGVYHTSLVPLLEVFEERFRTGALHEDSFVDLAVRSFRDQLTRTPRPSIFKRTCYVIALCVRYGCSLPPGRNLIGEVLEPLFANEGAIPDEDEDSFQKGDKQWWNTFVTALAENGHHPDLAAAGVEFVPSLFLIKSLAVVKDRDRLVLVTHMLDVLYLNGADPNISSSNGMTALGFMLTTKLPFYDASAFFQIFENAELYFPILRCMLHYGMDTEKFFTFAGRPRKPMGYAAEKAEEFFEFLREWKTDGNMPVDKVTLPKPREPVSARPKRVIPVRASKVQGILKSPEKAQQPKPKKSISFADQGKEELDEVNVENGKKGNEQEEPGIVDKFLSFVSSKSEATKPPTKKEPEATIAKEPEATKTTPAKKEPEATTAKEPEATKTTPAKKEPEATKTTLAKKEREATIAPVKEPETKKTTPAKKAPEATKKDQPPQKEQEDQEEEVPVVEKDPKTKVPPIRASTKPTKRTGKSTAAADDDDDNDEAQPLPPPAPGDDDEEVPPLPAPTPDDDEPRSLPPVTADEEASPVLRPVRLANDDEDDTSALASSSSPLGTSSTRKLSSSPRVAVSQTMKERLASRNASKAAAAAAAKTAAVPSTSPPPAALPPVKAPSSPPSSRPNGSPSPRRPSSAAANPPKSPPPSVPSGSTTSPRSHTSPRSQTSPRASGLRVWLAANKLDALAETLEKEGVADLPALMAFNGLQDLQKQFKHCIRAAELLLLSRALAKEKKAMSGAGAADIPASTSTPSSATSSTIEEKSDDKIVFE